MNRRGFIKSLGAAVGAAIGLNRVAIAAPVAEEVVDEKCADGEVRVLATDPHAGLGFVSVKREGDTWTFDQGDVVS